MGGHHFSDFECCFCEEYVGDNLIPCFKCGTSGCNDCIERCWGTKEKWSENLGLTDEIDEADEEVKKHEYKNEPDEYGVKLCPDCASEFERICFDCYETNCTAKCNKCKKYFCNDCSSKDAESNAYCWDCAYKSRYMEEFILQQLKMTRKELMEKMFLSQQNNKRERDEQKEEDLSEEKKQKHEEEETSTS